MSKQNETSYQQIDLRATFVNMWRMLRRRLIIVLLISCVVGGLFGARRYHSYSPVYQSNAVLAVDAASNDVYDITGYYWSSATAHQIAGSFSVFLSSDLMVEEMLDVLGTPTIRGTVTASNIADSNLFSITVTSSNAQDAYDVLCAVIKVYPTVAAQIIGNIEIEVIQEPYTPSTPANRRVWIPDAIKFGLIALAAQLVIFFILAQFRQVINSSEQIKRFSNINCIGHIPKINSKKYSSKRRIPISISNPGIPDYYHESIRTVRTRLLHSMDDQKAKTLLITSTMSGEGKSTVIANLAISIARAGHRVILIDGDLRVQSLRDFFDVSDDTIGLAELLEDSSIAPADALQKIEGTNLRLISGSYTVRNPSELLDAERLSHIIDTLSGEADYILIDTPPIGMLSDTATLLGFVRNVLFIVRSEYIVKQQLVDALEHISDAGASIVGYILNCTKGRSMRYGYGRYGYGKYGYGKYGYGRYGYNKSGYGKKKKSSSDE